MKAKKILHAMVNILGRKYPSADVLIIPKNEEIKGESYRYWLEEVGLYLNQPYDNYKKKMVLAKLSCNGKYLSIPIFLRKDKNACEYYVFENAEMLGGEFHNSPILLAESIEQQFVDFLKKHVDNKKEVV